MRTESRGERRAAGPARALSAVLAAAAASTLLFWLVGGSLPGGSDLQVGFLVITFGIFLALSVGYSMTVDRVWRRVREDAHEAIAAYKGDFVVQISRELRSSLTGIVGFAQMIDPEVIGEENAEALNTVIGQAAELSRVVDDLTLAAQLDMGMASFEPEATTLLDEVETAVGFLDVMGLPVSVECVDARIDVDPEAFRHVLRNLMVNAHRHGAAPVAVRGQKFGDRYFCQVVDSGLGVAPEMEKQLFDLDPDSRLRRSEAVGTGLAVVARVAREQGWGLEYRRLRGETHFIVTVPALASEEEEVSFRPRLAIPRIVKKHNQDEGEESVAIA